MADSMTTEQKIAHFLKLAEDSGATQAERDTASAQAERLMLKHNIDRLTAMDADTNRDERIITDSVFFGGVYAEARAMAVGQVIIALGMRSYTSASMGLDDNTSHSGRVVKGYRITVVGFESELPATMRLIRSLDLQNAVAMKDWAKTKKDAWYWYSAADKTKEKQAFCTYFGVGAAKRIKAEREEAVADAEPGTALVLVDRAARVTAYVDSMSNLRRVTSRKRYGASGANAGAAAGANANTGGRAAITGQRAIGR